MKHQTNEEKKLIYVATRLFDPMGRLLGAILEKACFKAIKQLTDKDQFELYLPFRDSNESVLVQDGESITQAIYRIDCQKLKHSAFILCPFDGLRLDEGIAFEIGYAYAQKTPIVLVALNFFNYQLLGTETIYLIDPFVSFFSNLIIDCSEFKLSKKDKSRKGYYRKLKQTLSSLQLKVEKEIYLFITRHSPKINPSPLIKERQVHIEFGGRQFYHQHNCAKEFQQKLLQRNIVSTISDRYSQENLNQGIIRDLALIEQASIVITWSDGSEVDAEVALMQGYAVGLQKKVYFFYSGKKEIRATNGYRSIANLMIAESALKICYTMEEIIAEVVNSF